MDTLWQIVQFIQALPSTDLFSFLKGFFCFVLVIVTVLMIAGVVSLFSLPFTLLARRHELKVKELEFREKLEKSRVKALQDLVASNLRIERRLRDRQLTEHIEQALANSSEVIVDESRRASGGTPQLPEIVEANSDAVQPAPRRT